MAKEIFEEVLGRTVATQSVPVEALQGHLAAATDPMQQSFTSLMLCVAASLGQPPPGAVLSSGEGRRWE